MMNEIKFAITLPYFTLLLLIGVVLLTLEFTGTVASIIRVKIANFDHVEKWLEENKD